MVITMERRDKTNYYLDIAETVLERGTCLRRNFGAIIVKNDQIISTGYVGAPGQRYELCRSVHAEQNAIIAASRNDMIGATLYLVGRDVNTGELVPNASACSMCKRMIINAGIDRVVIRNTPTEYTEINVLDWVRNDESLEGVLGY